MTKIRKRKDNWGQIIIDVNECDNFEYEKQPDMPKLNKMHIKKNKVYIKSKRLPEMEKFDIIANRENYIKL